MATYHQPHAFTPGAGRNRYFCAVCGRKEDHELHHRRVKCDSCQLARINGIICHETGCPHMRSRYDANAGEWIKQRTCFDCGFTCDADDPCCSREEPEPIRYEWADVDHPF